MCESFSSVSSFATVGTHLSVPTRRSMRQTNCLHSYVARGFLSARTSSSSTARRASGVWASRIWVSMAAWMGRMPAHSIVTRSS